MSEKKKLPPDGCVEVFCRSIQKNGKTIYPKHGQFFHFYVKQSKKAA